MNAQSKPRLELSGQDGNAFLILGRAMKAARTAGWTPERIEAFTTDAQSSDYNHLLQTCMKHFDVV